MPFLFASLLVILSKSFLAGAANIVNVPKYHEEVSPFLASVSPFRTGEQFVHSRKFLSDNEIVLKRYSLSHVNIVLVEKRLKLLTDHIYGTIFLNLSSVVKGELSDFLRAHAIYYDFSDRGVIAILFDGKRVDNGHMDFQLMQNNRDQFVVPISCLHEHT